jgi:hypothetical protein
VNEYGVAVADIPIEALLGIRGAPPVERVTSWASPLRRGKRRPWLGTARSACPGGRLRKRMLVIAGLLGPGLMVR